MDGGKTNLEIVREAIRRDGRAKHPCDEIRLGARLWFDLSRESDYSEIAELKAGKIVELKAGFKNVKRSIFIEGIRVIRDETLGRREVKIIRHKEKQMQQQEELTMTISDYNSAMAILGGKLFDRATQAIEAHANKEPAKMDLDTAEGIVGLFRYVVRDMGLVDGK